jgi:hypothetical protein
MPKFKDFRVGDHVRDTNEGRAEGIITNQSVKFGNLMDDRWTIKRFDGVTGGDDNHGWICNPLTMTLISTREVGYFD